VIRETTTAKPRKTRAASPGTRPAATRPAAAAGHATTRRGSSKGRNLVVVESPAKARTVQSILGNEYRVIASVGHVRDLPNFGYGVANIEEGDFTPRYVVVKNKARGVDKSTIIKEIADAAAEADRVYLSTDPDREGEAISWHIREAANIAPAKTSRVVFHEITRPAIEEAFRHPGELNMDLVDAQQTRRVLDRLIGFPLTWFVQGKVARSATAGRVQSVALRLIVEREREVQAFKAVEHWSVHARLEQEGSAFTANLVRLHTPEGRAVPGWLRPPAPDAADRGVPAIPDEQSASALASAFRAAGLSVVEVKKGTRRQSPAPPFTTSTFQQAANNRLGLGAQRAMAIAQQLYEGVEIPGQGPTGLITYMRTDSFSVSPLAREEARAFIAERWGVDHVPEKHRVYRTRTRGAQEAHEAIRPTSAARTPESLQGILSRDQLAAYRLIWQRFVASQMADAVYDTVRVDLEADITSAPVPLAQGRVGRGRFAASVRTLVFAGHLAVYGRHATDAETAPDDETEGTLPALSAGDRPLVREVSREQHFTEPPARYTEASLVRALEEKGIGRPSTYATIVETVLKRDYVKKEGRALVPQELGFLVNDLLVQYVDEYVAVPFTSMLEGELDEIASGKRDYESVVREFWAEFSQRVEQARQAAPKVQEVSEYPCTVCGQANLVLKWGRNGRFFACPRYPECSNSLPMGEDGQPVEQAKPVPTTYACPKCGSLTVQKSGPYGPYVDCTRREAGSCDFRSGVPVGVACPEEPESGQLVEKRTKRGVFFGCWNYPECSYTTNSLEPGKMAAVRGSAERAAANAKLKERSARGKAAFAARRASAGRARRAG